MATQHFQAETEGRNALDDQLTYTLIFSFYLSTYILDECLLALRLRLKAKNRHKNCYTRYPVSTSISFNVSDMTQR